MDTHNNYSFYKLLNALLDYSESKLKIIEEAIYKKSNLLLENIFIITIGIHAYTKGIRDLAKTSNVAAGNVLLRSIFEGLVNIKYIARDKSQLRAVAFELHDIKKQKNFVQDIIDNFDNHRSFVENSELSSHDNCKKKLEEIENRRKEYLNIFEKNYGIKIENSDSIKWETYVWKKVPDVGLVSEYNSIYQYLCSFTHLDATGLKTFFQLGGNKYDIKIEKNKDEVESLLGATCVYYSKTLKEVLTQFGLYRDEEFKPFLKVFEALNNQI